MVTVRFFVPVALAQFSKWYYVEKTLPVVPVNGMAIMVGPSRSGSYLDFTLENGYEDVIVRTDDPIVNCFLGGFVGNVEDALSAIPEGSDVTLEQVFDNSCRLLESFGFKECRRPDFNSPDFDSEFS